MAVPINELLQKTDEILNGVTADDPGYEEAEFLRIEIINLLDSNKKLKLDDSVEEPITAIRNKLVRPMGKFLEACSPEKHEKGQLLGPSLPRVLAEGKIFQEFYHFLAPALMNGMLEGVEIEDLDEKKEWIREALAVVGFSESYIDNHIDEFAEEDLEKIALLALMKIHVEFIEVDESQLYEKIEEENAKTLLEYVIEQKREVLETEQEYEVLQAQRAADEAAREVKQEDEEAELEVELEQKDPDEEDDLDDAGPGLDDEEEEFLEGVEEPAEEPVNRIDVNPIEEKKPSKKKEPTLFSIYDQNFRVDHHLSQMVSSGYIEYGMNYDKMLEVSRKEMAKYAKWSVEIEKEKAKILDDFQTNGPESKYYEKLTQYPLNSDQELDRAAQLLAEDRWATQKGRLSFNQKTDYLQKAALFGGCSMKAQGENAVISRGGQDVLRIERQQGSSKTKHKVNFTFTQNPPSDKDIAMMVFQARRNAERSGQAKDHNRLMLNRRPVLKITHTNPEVASKMYMTALTAGMSPELSPEAMSGFYHHDKGNELQVLNKMNNSSRSRNKFINRVMKMRVDERYAELQKIANPQSTASENNKPEANRPAPQA